MELADAGSLDSRIDREKRVPELDILDTGIKVASALASLKQLSASGISIEIPGIGESLTAVRSFKAAPERASR